MENVKDTYDTECLNDRRQMTANTQITTMAQMIMTTPQITYMSYDVNCINDNNDTDDIT